MKVGHECVGRVSLGSEMMLGSAVVKGSHQTESDTQFAEIEDGL